MPGFTTHYLFGQQAYQLIQSESLRRSIQKRHTVYSLGLQGPDIFFYDILSAAAKKNPGTTAHTADTRKFLRYLLESPEIFTQKKERRTAQVYILGFIGHYLLDTACHPYIYAMTRYSRHPKGYLGKHLLLETDVDSALLWHYERRLPSEFHQSESIALSKEQKNTVATLLYFAFSRTYPKLGITKRRIFHAIHAMQLGTKLLYDPSGRKKSALRRLESVFFGYPLLSSLIASDALVFYKDPCNLTHRPWKNPWDETRRSTESFLELFENAKETYGHLINELDAFFSLEHSPAETADAKKKLLLALGNLCYHSGLSSAPYLL